MPRRSRGPGSELRHRHGPLGRAACAVDPANPGASATYTITDLKAAAALTTGSGSIQLEAPAGSVLPSNGAEYVVTDLSNSSGTGVPTVTSGGNANSVTLQVSKTIASGDVFQIVVAGVINPSAGQYRITFVGAVIGGTLPAPPPVHPTTTTTHPTTTTTPPSPSWPSSPALEPPTPTARW